MLVSIDFPRGSLVPTGEGFHLSTMHIVAAVLGLGLLVYLAIALLMPERFQ
jgi:K+-transporting ATPase KdpF subunit